MRLQTLALAIAPIFLLACSTVITESPVGGGGTGTTTTFCEGCGGYTTGGGGPGGMGGEGGALPSCEQQHGAFSYTLVDTHTGQAYDCSTADPGGGPGSPAYHLEGVVLSSTGEEIVFDTCPPTADCQGLKTVKLTVQTDGGFWVGVPTGAFIQVDSLLEFSWGCTSRLLVRGLPSWYGTPNPYGNSAQLYFAGADGTLAAIPGAPFTVDKLALGCGGQPTGCGQAESYDLLLETNGGSTSVPQGGSTWFTGSDGSSLTFHNLRSYDSGWCDDYWNYAYWAIPALEY